jgi:hypothetical protein
MITVRARVRNGRLVVDEATDLPDGTELELVADEVAGWLRAAPLSEAPLTAEEVGLLKAIRDRASYTSHEALRERLGARKR